MEQAKRPNRKFELDEESLNEAIRTCGNSAVGKIMKRVDIADSKEELKKEIRELIYEEFRSLKGWIIAYNWGMKFKTPSQSPEQA